CIPFLVIALSMITRPFGRGEPDAGAMAYRAGHEFNAIVKPESGTSLRFSYLIRSVWFPYILVPWLLLVGVNDVSLRLFNIVGVMLAAACFYLLFRKFSSRPVAAVAVAIALLNPYVLNNFVQN